LGSLEPREIAVSRGPSGPLELGRSPPTVKDLESLEQRAMERETLRVAREKYSPAPDKKEAPSQAARSAVAFDIRRFLSRMLAPMLVAALIGASLYACIRGINVVLATLFLPPVESQRYSQAWTSALSASSILLSAALFPLVEEYLFRRKLYGFAVRHSSPWVAALAVSLAFCMMHVEQFGTLYMLNSFLLGMVWVIYNISQSVAISTACHGAFNLCVLAPKGSFSHFQASTGTYGLDPTVLAAGLALFAFSLAWHLLRWLDAMVRSQATTGHQSP
jgi:membrane protease YdiL (CAAX protease family)